MRDELTALRDLMAQTDHVPNKLIEGLLTTLEGATALTLASALAAYVRSALQESGDTLSRRAAWRESIARLEDELARAEESGREDA